MRTVALVQVAVFTCPDSRDTNIVPAIAIGDIEVECLHCGEVFAPRLCEMT